MKIFFIPIALRFSHYDYNALLLFIYFICESKFAQWKIFSSMKINFSLSRSFYPFSLSRLMRWKFLLRNSPNDLDELQFNFNCAHIAEVFCILMCALWLNLRDELYSKDWVCGNFSDRSKVMWKKITSGTNLLSLIASILGSHQSEHA
jgi:hypothetical protein